MSGNLFVVSAPSGAGKTSLVNALLGINQTHRPVSFLHLAFLPAPANRWQGLPLRQPRCFFWRWPSMAIFVESAEVYGNLYGTSQSWISKEMHDGRDILLEIDWQGAAQVRNKFPGCISIFILPPSLQALETRLTGRKQDSAEVIAKRLQAAQEDIAPRGRVRLCYY